MSRRKARADKQEPRSLKTKQWMDVNPAGFEEGVSRQAGSGLKDAGEHMTLVKRKQNEQYIPKQRVGSGSWAEA